MAQHGVTLVKLASWTSLHQIIQPCRNNNVWCGVTFVIVMWCSSTNS